MIRWIIIATLNRTPCQPIRSTARLGQATCDHPLKEEGHGVPDDDDGQDDGKHDVHYDLVRDTSTQFPCGDTDAVSSDKTRSSLFALVGIEQRIGHVVPLGRLDGLIDSGSKVVVVLGEIQDAAADQDKLVIMNILPFKTNVSRARTIGLQLS